MIKQLKFSSNYSSQNYYNEPNNVIYLQYNTVTKTLELIDKTHQETKVIPILHKGSSSNTNVNTQQNTLSSTSPITTNNVEPVVENTNNVDNNINSSVEQNIVIPQTIQNNIEENNFSSPLTFTAHSETNILIRKVKSPNTVSLQYNKNNTGWIDYSIGNVIDLADGDTIAFSGTTETFSKDTANYYKFVLSGENVQVSGNIQSLVNYKQNVNEYQYYKLFNGCSSIVTAPELPVTTLANNCYQEMFADCENLSTAPILPANIIAPSCYKSMFSGCATLTEAPCLPSINLEESCYESMFNGCIALTSAPSLQATELANACYHSMFKNCTSLTEAPNLPATTLKQSCYQNMFYRCKNLIEAPNLPATELEGLCYYGMFHYCSSLNSINISFTQWTPTNATFDWVANVSSNGTFYKPEELTESFNGDTIPQGWTVINK